MIFVTVGTQNNSFKRLIEKIDELKLEGKIQDEVIVQTGYTKYTPKSNIKTIDFMQKDEMEKYIEKSDFVITHGGVGSIIDCLKKNKKIIAVARNSNFGEHVNDHQKQIVEQMNKCGYLIGITSIDELENSLDKVKTFVPKPYVFDNSSLLKYIDNYLEKILK